MPGFAFGSLSLHRVTAAIGPDNGAWRDSVLYSLLHDEWAT